MITNPKNDLTCEICLEPFNLENHLPKSLPCCGKSLCRKCLEGILKKHARECPWCKTRMTSESETFKTNLQLLNVIEEDSKWEKCPQHGESMKLVCLKDRCKLCPYCGLSSECKNHDLVNLVHLKQTSDERIKELKDSLGSIQDEAGRFEEIISQNRGIFHGIINESFDKQIEELKKMKVKTLMKLNSAFHEKRNTVASNFGQQHVSLRAEVQAKIYEHMNFLKAKDPVSLIQEDMSDLKARVSSLIGRSQEAKNFEQDLSKLAPIFRQKPALEQKEDFNSLINSLKSDLSHQIEQKKIKISDDEEIQVKVSGLCLKLREGFLPNSGELSCSGDLDKSVKTVSLKLSLIKDMRSVTFSSQNLDLNEGNLEAIECILTKTPLISRISLLLESTSPKTSLERMYQLFSIIFRKPRNVENLCISFPPNNDLVMMFNVLISQFSLLRKLKIQFFTGEYSQDVCEDFAQNFSSLAPGLEKLDLNFSGTNFPISVIQKIFISMPKLEEFLLNVSKMTNVNDEMLGLLTRNMKKLTPKLKKFNLDASQTKVSDHFVVALKTKMSFIPNLSIKVDAYYGSNASLNRPFGSNPLGLPSFNPQGYLPIYHHGWNHNGDAYSDYSRYNGGLWDIF